MQPYLSTNFLFSMVRVILQILGRNHDDAITNLEPDILECEVKSALESITTNKAIGGDGMPVELFQILSSKGTDLDLSPQRFKKCFGK